MATLSSGGSTQKNSNIEQEGYDDPYLEHMQNDLESRQNYFGPHHKSVADSFMNIGHYLLKRRDYSASLEAYQSAVQIYSSSQVESNGSQEGEDDSSLGTSFEDSLKVAEILNNMGLIFRRQKEYEEAIKSYSGSLEIYQFQHTRMNNPDILDINKGITHNVNLELKIVLILQSMARIYSQSFQQIDDAIYCHQDVVTTLIGSDGCSVNSPTSIVDGSVHSISDGSSCNKNPNSAKLTEHERVRIMSTSLNALAQFHLYKQSNTMGKNDHDESASIEEDENPMFYFSEALDVLRTVKNPKSTTSIFALANGGPKIMQNGSSDFLANIYSNQGIIDLRLDLGNTLMQMGDLHKKRGQIDLALECFEQARDARFELYNNNEEHPEITATLYQLGQCHELRADLNEAMKYYKLVLMVRSKLLGVDHVDVANVLNNMSNILQLKHDWEGSIQLNGQALSIYRKTVDQLSKSAKKLRRSQKAWHSKLLEHMAGALQNRAALFLRMGKEDDSIATYQEAIEILISVKGNYHVDVATVSIVLGDIYRNKVSFEDAKRYYMEALLVYKKLGVNQYDENFVKVTEQINLIDTNNCTQSVVIEEQELVDNMLDHNKPENVKPAEALWIDMESDNEEDYSNSFYISTKPKMNDSDSVSQITFHENEETRKNSRKKKKWFSTSYVKNTFGKIAEVTEEFLAGPNIPTSPKKKEVLPPLSEIDVIDEENIHEGSTKKLASKGLKSQKVDDDLASNIGMEIDDLSKFNLDGFYGLDGLDGMESFITPSQDTEIDDNIPKPEQDGNDENDENDGNKSNKNKEKVAVDMDDLLAQINVVTCDMDESGSAKPFRELLSFENRNQTPEQGNQGTPPNQTFSSACSMASSRNRSNADNARVRKYMEKLKQEKTRLGPTHPDIAKITGALAYCYSSCKEYMRAIRYYMETLNIQKQSSGSSEDVAQTLILIGDMHSELDHLDKAMNYYLEAREIHIQLYGDRHPLAAQSLNCIGVIYRKLGDFDNAMDFHQQALSIQKASLSENEHNPDVSQTLVYIGELYYKERNSLTKIRSSTDTYKNFIKSGMLGMIAFAHGERGEYKMAMKFYEEVLQVMRNEGDKKSLPSIATILNSLGSLGVKTGQYEEAMDFHKQALQLMRSFQNQSKSDILFTTVNIGIVEYYAGNLKKALDIFEAMLPKLYQLHKNNNPRVARTLFYIGLINNTLGNSEKAMIHLEPALRIQRSILQIENPDTLQTLTEIGKIHACTGKLDHAQKEFTEILMCQKSIFGDKHPFVADTLHQIGLTYTKKADYNCAMKMFEKCYDMRRQLLGIDHPDVAQILLSIGNVHSKEGRTDKALTIYEDVLRIQRDILGNNHYLLAYSLYSKGNAHSLQTQYTDAIKCYNEASEIASAALGNVHDLVADIHIAVGKVHLRKCEFDDANKSYKKSMNIYKAKKYGKNDSRLVNLMTAIAKVKEQEELCV